MSPTVTSAKPGESTSATDPNTFFSSTANSNSIQISYASGDGHVTTEELQSFPQFLADVEDVVEYPIATSGFIHEHGRSGQESQLIRTCDPSHYHHVTDRDKYCSMEKPGKIDMSLKLVTIVSDPNKPNSILFLKEGQANSDTVPNVSSNKSAEISQQRQDSGIFEDRGMFEESISSDLEVNCSGSVNSDLEEELHESLSSDIEIHTDSATSDLEKELIPITQKLERADHRQEAQAFEFNASYFERSLVPEAEVIAACRSTQYHELYNSPPPTPGATEDFDDSDDFSSPPPTPTYEAAPFVTENIELCKTPVHDRPPTPTPVHTRPHDNELSKSPVPELPSTPVSAPAMPYKQEICKSPILERPPTPVMAPSPAPDEDSPPILKSIYEESNPEITKHLHGQASGISTNSSTNSESPPVLTQEVPTPSFPAVFAKEPVKKRRGTRKFITPRNCQVTPHSSAEIQERVKNRQRNSVSSYCSSVSSEHSTKSEPASPMMYTPIQTEHKYFKSNGEQLEDKCSKSKSKPRNMKRKGSDDKCAGSGKKSKVDGLYIVEKILRKTIVGGVPYFLVKWLNYTDAKNTWEPGENFSVELITAFENSLLEASSNPKKMETPAKRILPPPLIRRRSSLSKKKCTGCASYPTTFTDQRLGLTGFDHGYTYSKTRESFVLDGVKCGLVEFDEKRVLELIPFSIINEKVRAQLVT